MARLRDTFGRVFRRWIQKRRPAFTYTKVQTVESMTDIPDQFGWEIFVVTRNSAPRWVVLQCPCHCGERLNVNLMRTAHPHWKLSLSRGKVSLSPSIWVSSDKCGSHFWLAENGVFWCPRRPEKY
jgi:hypothetical protein